jgi:hypothetical protein
MSENPLDRNLLCASCRTLSPVGGIVLSGYVCPVCGEPICILCGCTEAVACLAQCNWIAPGICSSHEAELKSQVKRVFGTAVLAA